VRDASGAVSLKVEDDPVNPGGFPYYRHWRAERAVAPPVVVTYRMRSFTGVATPGPQFDFYSHGGGVSGGGVGGTTWFNEGLNVYYTRLLLLRSGHAPAPDYERDINQTARAIGSRNTLPRVVANSFAVLK